MPVPWSPVKVNVFVSGPSNSRALDRLRYRGRNRVMLIITSETQPANASIQGLFARGCRHPHPPLGRVGDKAGSFESVHGAVDEIHVTSEPDSQSAVLRLDGALHTPIDGVLRSTVESLFQSGVRRVLLDLSGVSSIDAAGVGELIQIFTAAASVGGVLEIERMSSQVRRVLEITGVRWLLDVESPGARSTCR